MSKRDHYPAGVPCWVETLQPDVRGARDFYGALFGWEFSGPGPMPGEGAEYFVARVGGCDVAGVGTFPQHDAPSAPAWITYVRVDRVDEAVERVRAACGSVLVAPFDVAPAGRMAVVADPALVSFCLWEAGTREGAQRVNEPGAWSMSALITADPEGAVPFYRDVFGWQTQAFDAAPGVTLFRLPGYVGGEPQQPVPRDVVAAMMRTPDGTPIPSHWSIDFWVRDANSVAARTPELGGRVLVPPHDALAFTRAVIADPQGAVFTVSQLNAR